MSIPQAPLFDEYSLGRAFDEMFGAPGQPRPHYAALFEQLGSVEATELQRRQQVADRAFLHQGITFTVYGDSRGTERIFPYDLLPRIITGDEWRQLDRGLTQRITALNLFLHDIYHEGRILRDGVVPRELVFSCPHYRREMRGLRVQGDRYVSVAGTDLVRVADGQFAVLEDNLRVPSGVSYMLANRAVMKRTFSRLLSRYSVRPDRPLRAGAAAHPARPVAAGAPEPDRRAADARRLQLGLLRARVPRAPDGHRAGRGARPVRPRQRRLHAHHVGRAARRRDLPPRRRRLRRPAGVPRRLAARRARACSTPTAPATSRSANAIGTGVADDKAVYAVRAGHHQVLPGRGADPAPTSRPTCSTTRGSATTCSSTSTSWWSRRSANRAATAC